MAVSPLPPPTRPLRAAATALAAIGVALAAATPAAAAGDPSRPGGTRSVIDSVEPPADGVGIEVLGGDNFLELTVQDGIEVVVLGYSEEPYLRVRRDGTVEENALSPAVSINADRLGGAADPEADPRAEPLWEEVGDGGRVAWHDHRIHWMARSDPAAAPDGVIQSFDVPLVVDGTPTVVSGRLLLVDAPFPWPVVLAGLAALGVAVALRRDPLGRAGAAWCAAAAAVALATTAGWWWENPPEVGGFPWGALLAVGALGCSSLAALRGARSPRTGGLLVMAAIALLSGWWIARVTVLWAAVVPTVLPPAVDRVATALVAGTTIGAAVAVALPGLRPAASPPPPRR